MDKDELETYQVQLSQVELALASDPDNTELSSLQSELQELINLTKAAQNEAAQSASTRLENASTARKASSLATSKVWSAGDDCLAKYSNDGAWYPARITSVGGSIENRVYSVVFRGYNTTELLKSTDLKEIPPSMLISLNSSSSGPGGSNSSSKRKTREDELEKERKKKKNEKKVEVKAAKAKEQNEKQQTWQKFAKKSEKKGVHIAGVAGTSIFKTPDNPLGKGLLLLFISSKDYELIHLFWISGRNRKRERYDRECS